jgi:hypothetical protein
VFPAGRGDENPRLAILVRSFVSGSMELHAHRPNVLHLIPPIVTRTPTATGPNLQSPPATEEWSVALKPTNITAPLSPSEELLALRAFSF